MSDLQSSEKDWLFTNLQVAESHNEKLFSIFLLLKLKISYEPEFKSLFSFLVLCMFVGAASLLIAAQIEDRFPGHLVLLPRHLK